MARPSDQQATPEAGQKVGGRVAQVLEHARSRPALLSQGRLICIDGPAGSGKTTLAAEILDAVPDAVVLHMDDMYEGWSGLNGDTGSRLRDTVMTPLAAGKPGHYRRYDWTRGEFAELHIVPPGEVLVLEGVGSGDLALTPFRSTLVWVEAPDDLCTERGIARDRDLHEPGAEEGSYEPWDDEGYRARWVQFKADETRFFLSHRLPESANLRFTNL